MAKSIMGAHGSMGACPLTPSSSPAQPHWNTITSTP